MILQQVSSSLEERNGGGVLGDEEEKAEKKTKIKTMAFNEYKVISPIDS